MRYRHNPTGPFRTVGARALAVITAAFLAATAHAQDAETGLDRLWSHAELHSGSAGDVVQRVALSGRLQLDQANVDSGTEDFSDFDLRRFRLGFRFDFAAGVRVHVESDLDPNGGDIGYRKLTDAYISWSRGDAARLTVGKHGVAFTMDGQTSSKSLLTIDRSNLSNNIWFTDEYIPGISVNGTKAGFVYDVGVFSSGPEDRGFGGSSGGEFVLLTLGRDFSSRLNAREALLRVNYVDNDPHVLNSFTRPLEEIVSVNFAFERDRWGVRSDVSAARGYLGQSDLAGFMLMPFLNLSGDLQLVTRYTRVESDDVNGVRFGRYENALESGRGDKYSEMYFGVNYYIHGHKLKLQTGLQYADMNDAAADGGAYTGWGITTGFRASW